MKTENDTYMEPLELTDEQINISFAMADLKLDELSSYEDVIPDFVFMAAIYGLFMNITDILLQSGYTTDDLIKEVNLVANNEQKITH
jgi:hypothetical protein